MPTNPQEEFWAGNEGDQYLRRNFKLVQEHTWREPFFNLFDEIGNKDISILEVGCNCGLNFGILRDRGYTNLTGIDIGAAAVAEARQRYPDATIVEGSILDLPFEDGQFDVVFSSGVLIHQNPEGALFQAMDEMYRCSSRYILGLEDYSDHMTSITYRNKSGFCWRGPYSSFWQDPTSYPWGKPHKHGFILQSSPQREYYKFEK
jgi:pseudaminic acid biosynthesis-associated methylase